MNHTWGPEQHYLRCADGTVADTHIRICGDCYDVEVAGPCDCTTEERQRAATPGKRWVLDAGWGAA